MTISEEALRAAQEELKKRDDKVAMLEKEIARAIAGTETANKTVEAQAKTIEELQKSVKELREVSVKSILEQVEATKSSVEAVARRIRQGAGPVSMGRSVEKGEFNLVGMMACAARGKALKGWEKEYEALKDYNERIQSKGMITVDDEGGFFLPEQVLADVIAPFYRDSVFIALDGEGQTRASVVQGLVGETVRIPSVQKGAIAYHMGSEASKHVPSRIKAGAIKMTRRKVGVATVFTKEMVMNGNAQGFMNFTERDMTRALVELVDSSIMYGKGSDFEPLGLTNRPKIRRFYATDQKVYDAGLAPASITGGMFNFASTMRIDNALRRSNVPVDSSFATISSHELFTKLRLLRFLLFAGQDPASAPFLSMLPLSDERLAEIIRPYAGTSMISATKEINGDQKYTDVVRGNLAEIVVGMWSGIAVGRSEEAGDLWWSDEEAVKMTFHYDTVVRHDESLIICPDADADLDSYVFNHTT